jgi:hypothetical protein
MGTMRLVFISKVVKKAKDGGELKDVINVAALNVPRSCLIKYLPL